MSLVFEQVSYRYPSSNEVALEEVTFSLESGELLGIIGHTGSGKSTLIQHINGLLLPTHGRVLVDGIDVAAGAAQRKEVRRKVGLVFQYPEYQLFASTVEEDVAFGPRNLGLSREEATVRVREALAQVGLSFDECVGRSPFDFSGGQRRRIALAGILAMNPEYLVLDEPMAGLDPRGRENVKEFLAGLRAQGMTVIMVSHSMEDVAELATKVLVLKDGRVFMQGTPQEVFSHPQELREINLGVPQAAHFAHKLRACGFSLPDNVLSLSQLADAIALELGGAENGKTQRAIAYEATAVSIASAAVGAGDATC